jgi:hypothetical protein
MARVQLLVWGFKCERCGHEWLPRPKGDEEPRVCPKCKSPYWDRPKKTTVPSSGSEEETSGGVAAVGKGGGLGGTEQ